MGGAPSDPSGSTGADGAATADAISPQQLCGCDMNVPGWPKMYPTDVSDDQDVAQT
jgi:hypothetical protein